LKNIEYLVGTLKEITDFRSARGQRYRLYNILSIFILAVISGADDFVAVAAYAKGKKDFLCKHDLLDGIHYPSHDLFCYVLKSLDKKSLSQVLAGWLSTSVSQTDSLPMETTGPVTKKMIHIDGKSLRASRDGNSHTRTALQIVTAYCSDTSISIGQELIEKKSCEKTAIPKLLKLLDLKDTVTTIDAIATTKKNTEIICGKGGDYLLALKKNNKHFYLEVETFFKHFGQTSLVMDFFGTHDKGHGRLEYRVCKVISDLSYFPDAEGWRNLKSIICIESRRTVNGKISNENRFYLSSLEPNAKALGQAIRKHWTVENELHWSLDVSFNEDRCRIKDKNAAANFAAVRRFALALLKNAKVSKLGIKNQRLQAAWDDQFLEKIFLFFQKNVILEK